MGQIETQGGRRTQDTQTQEAERRTEDTVQIDFWSAIVTPHALLPRPPVDGDANEGRVQKSCASDEIIRQDHRQDHGPCAHIASSASGPAGVVITNLLACNTTPPIFSLCAFVFDSVDAVTITISILNQHFDYLTLNSC